MCWHGGSGLRIKLGILSQAGQLCLAFSSPWASYYFDPFFCKFWKTTFNSSNSCCEAELASINGVKCSEPSAWKVIYHGKVLLFSVLLAAPIGACWNKVLNVNPTFLSSLLLSPSAFPIFPSWHYVLEIHLLLFQRKGHDKIWTSVLQQLGSPENDVFPSKDFCVFCSKYKKPETN